MSQAFHKNRQTCLDGTDEGRGLIPRLPSEVEVRDHGGDAAERAQWNVEHRARRVAPQRGLGNGTAAAAQDVGERGADALNVVRLERCLDEAAERLAKDRGVLGEVGVVARELSAVGLCNGAEDPA